MLTGESVQHRVGEAVGQVTEHANRTIEQRTEERLRHLAEHPNEISGRLAEIDREWTDTRVLTATAAGLIAIGAALAMTVDRRMAILPAVAAGFMLEHAMMGRGPLSLGFRELGFRSADDIAHEKFALKALRGDFDKAKASGAAGYGAGDGNARDRAWQVLEAVRA